ncbi:periodic tryptophan protein 1 homolog [Bactrocera neohumeralis]|uniref:periodic tryptophan protein 1 homolog n=1 Tax=Bactrocera tryoni TaxID=59916 RepID=UPI001A976ECC|nr:periodic tryptophan protein 1 homolog [Bactrocera tryoni]XP_050326479.1 periodic tryptophan protein 1 homolog [Bactrocera neohumeralis]
MEETDGPQEASIDFVPALCFVPRGVAKERPEKIVLTQSELARIIEDTKSTLAEDGEDDDDDDEDIDHEDDMEIDDEAAASAGNRNPDDEFGFDNYDAEGTSKTADIASVVDANEQLPDEDNDSEAEDEIIKPTDNLILVGHVQDDAASMEVWVFNEEEESLYTHHDFILPSFPLCIEWLNHDPGSDKPGNMCAIGCMDPVITIWDLDIQDSMEPTFKLGSKGSRKKHKEPYGHTDAVLDLSWNRHFEHILASGSVDQTLILWDLDEGQPHTTITAFEEKVQSLEFHPDEAQSILAGSADGIVRLFDCRNADTVDSDYVKWKIPGEVEKVLWNPTDTNHFVVGTNDGSLHYADRRQPNQLLWSIKGHEEEISGVCFNKDVANLLTSTSTDGMLKVWDFNASAIKEVYSHDFQMGRLQCMKQSPEDPFTLALGGEKPPRCRIYNIKNFEVVRKVFKIAEVLQ